MKSPWSTTGYGARVRRALLLSGFAVAALFSACGGGDEDGAPGDGQSAFPPGFEAAAEVQAADFPAPQGRTLEQLAGTIQPGAQAALASSVFVPGENRLAFGLLDAENAFLYGPSAVYVAPTPNERARGPFPAPIDSMAPEEPYLSETTGTDPASAKAVYEADVPLPQPGRYAVLVITQQGGGLARATTKLTVKSSSPIPAVGERPPAIDTPTVESVGGKIEKIETRVPPDDMHEVSFEDVLGKRPVALLFATPALCISRTCGPVTDLAVQLQDTYGEQMTFIHNEVYAGNDPSKGLRPQLRAFHLRTEPWLFTFDREGRVAARLEGAFGINAFRRAVEAALR